MSENWLVTTPIAHRGLHKGREIPENSMPAFEAAVNAGYAIELDVRLLRDGNVVVFHDDDMERLLNVRGRVEELKHEDLLRLRLFKGSYQAPLLDEVLKMVKGKVPLVIEIKSKSTSNQDLEKAVFELVKDYEGDFSIQSFNPYSLKYFKNRRPEIIRGLLSYNYQDALLNDFQKVLLRNLGHIPMVRPHYIGYQWQDLPYTPVSWARNHLGIPVLAWTVTSELQWNALKEHCDNLIFENFRP